MNIEALLILTVTVTLFLVAIMVCLYYLSDRRDYKESLWIVIPVLVALVAIASVWYKSSLKEQKAELQAWEANGCYVVDTECGSKTRYACQLKVLKEGNFAFGNVILKSHKTC